MKYIIGRPINGIPINGFEYANDEEGYTIKFPSLESAVNFLYQSGYTDESIETEGIEIMEVAI